MKSDEKECFKTLTEDGDDWLPDGNEFQRSNTASAGASGGPAPYRKIGPTGRLHGKAYYLSFVCIPCGNGRIRREQPSSELRTNFFRRFDKPDLNFQKLFTYSQSSGHIRIYSDIITHIRTGLRFIFQHSKKPAKYHKLQNRI